MRLLDRCAQTNRWRRVPTAEKLAAALAAILVSLVTRSPLVELAILALMTGLVLFGAGIGPTDYRKAATVPFAFILTGTLAQGVTLGFDGGWPHLGLADRHALSEALFFLLRSMAAISALLFLALTTPLTRLIQWTEERGLNPHLADIALLMFRMIWLLLDCLERGENALKNRLGHKSYRGILTSHGLLLAALLPRVLAHARRLEGGLAARGYEGRLLFLGSQDAARASRLAAIGAGFAALFLLGVFA